MGQLMAGPLPLLSPTACLLSEKLTKTEIQGKVAFYESNHRAAAVTQTLTPQPRKQPRNLHGIVLGKASPSGAPAH